MIAANDLDSDEMKCRPTNACEYIFLRYDERQWDISARLRTYDRHPCEFQLSARLLGRQSSQIRSLPTNSDQPGIRRSSDWTGPAAAPIR